MGGFRCAVKIIVIAGKDISLHSNLPCLCSPSLLAQLEFLKNIGRYIGSGQYLTVEIQCREQLPSQIKCLCIVNLCGAIGGIEQQRSFQHLQRFR